MEYDHASLEEGSCFLKPKSYIYSLLAIGIQSRVKFREYRYIFSTLLLLLRMCIKIPGYSIISRYVKTLFSYSYLISSSINPFFTIETSPSQNQISRLTSLRPSKYSLQPHPNPGFHHSKKNRPINQTTQMER